jgi:hypothetical protein
MIGDAGTHDPNSTAPHVDVIKATIIRNSVVQVLSASSPLTVAELKQQIGTSDDFHFNFALADLIESRVVHRSGVNRLESDLLALH